MLAPVEITTAFEGFRAEYDWKVLATGPGHGIQLQSGRLVVPVWLSTSAGKSAHHPSNNGVIYSDDGGQSWRAGEFAGRSSETLVDPSEAAVLELADGRVVFNSRSESKPHRRMVSYSRDGATGWTAPEFHQQLVEPICMASLARLSGGARRQRILFANPASLAAAKPPGEPGRSRMRRNLTLRLSYDEGQTWPVSRTIEPASSLVDRLGLVEALLDGGEVLRHERLDVGERLHPRRELDRKSTRLNSSHRT